MIEHNNKQRFHVCSSIRLPFEPKDKALKLREELRSHLKNLKCMDYNSLHAHLFATEKVFFDVENVLFYNIGSGSFSHLNLDEISFSLEDEMHGSKMEYRYLYELMNQSYIMEHPNCILEFNFEMKKVTGNLKPLDYWQGLNSGEVRIFNILKPREFGMDIQIELPEKNKNIVGIIKPLLDGIVSAFHYQEEVDSQVIAYLIQKMNVDEEFLKAQLSKKKYTFLGE